MNLVPVEGIAFQKSDSKKGIRREEQLSDEMIDDLIYCFKCNKSTRQIIEETGIHRKLVEEMRERWEVLKDWSWK